MNDIELKEVNDFLQENSIRNKFLPILLHIEKLKPVKFDIVEYNDKDGKTSSIQFEIDIGDGVDLISGRVCYCYFDKTPELKNNVIVELWWDEENYRTFSGPNNIIQCQNWLTLIMNKANHVSMYGFRTFEDLKAYRQLETLVPI